MRKYLITQGGNFYKANLHCHTDLSDGGFSPEDVKKMYMEKGYSVVAYTDHDILIDHRDLCDENFVALNGFEIETKEDTDKPKYEKKDNHICMIALDPDNLIQPCWHRTEYFGANAVFNKVFVKYDESLPDYVRVYSHEGITDIMTKGREKGFFVTYNHPTWSLETAREYLGYNNMHAMEICNYGAYSEGFCEYDDRAYDEMLREGKRIYCIMADDNHTKLNTFFGGWTMIKADKLEYKALTDSLLSGNFYSSMGPEITDLYYEDGRVYVRCSDARRVIMHTGVRRHAVKRADENGPVNFVGFKVMPYDKYIRITVEGYDGLCAETNAYFLDEFYEPEEEDK